MYTTSLKEITYTIPHCLFMEMSDRHWSHFSTLGTIYSTNNFLQNTINPLRWRYNGRYSVSNHQPHDCLLNRLFRRRSKKTSTLPVTGLFEGNSPGTGESPAQMASNAENVSIWWRHHTSYMRHTKSQDLNVSRLVLQLPLPNPLRPGVKSRTKT